MNLGAGRGGMRRGRASKPTDAGQPPMYSEGYGQGVQLFEDTSSASYGGHVPNYPPPGPGMQPPPYGMPPPPQQQGPPPAFIPGQQIFSEPMAAMAMQYGHTLAGQGKDLVNERLEKYVSVSKLKYYFAVDTAYVTKKMGLIFFPFTHRDWVIHYNQDEPVAPRYEINAPDLYIPAMAFVTYILTAGILLGTQNRFSPEQLGIQASSALGWLMLEIVAIVLSMYVLNISSSMKILDVVAFCSYKYVCMIAELLASIGFKTLGYYASLLYCSVSLCFFLMRNLHILLQTSTNPSHYARGGRRSLYLVLAICVAQPAIMFLLTHHLIKKEIEPIDLSL